MPAPSAVVERHGGAFPSEPAALRALPGIGGYTAAAIAAIAFDCPVAAVDGNVERVVARLYAIALPLASAKPRLKELAAALVPALRAGDFAQAMMDLGATICTPRRPRCVLCPWRGACRAAASGLAEKLPMPAPKPQRLRRYGVAFWLTRADGAVLLRRRPAEGLLGGMIEIPSTPWRAEPWTLAEAVDAAPAGGRMVGVAGHGAARLHPFPAGARNCRGAGLRRRAVEPDRQPGRACIADPDEEGGASRGFGALRSRLQQRHSNAISPASARRTGAKERR